MKRYRVVVPVAVYREVWVEAESSQEAHKLALAIPDRYWHSVPGGNLDTRGDVGFGPLGVVVYEAK